MGIIEHRHDVETTAGQTFIDTASCRCALRLIAEQTVTDPELTQAWRCIADHSQDIYTGLSGKWYLPEAEDGGRKAVAFSRAKTSIGYAANISNDHRLRLLSLNPHLPRPIDEQCTGMIRDRRGNMLKQNLGPRLARRNAQSPSQNRPRPRPSSSDENDGALPDERNSSFDDENSFFNDETTTFDDEPPASKDGISAFNDGIPSSTDQGPNPSDENAIPSPSSSKQGAQPTAPPDDERLATTRPPSTCILGELAIGVPLQNSSSWETVGCLPGPNNTLDQLPEYCPPTVSCQKGRLSGGRCPQQGLLEPFVCPPGSYCPLGSREQINCPSGYYCSVGVYEPTKCSAGASCPPGTNRNMSFLAPGLILALDLIVLLVIFALTICKRFKDRHSGSASGKRFSRLNKPVSFFDQNVRLKKYQSLQDSDLALESRITHVQRSETAFGGNFSAFDSKDDNELITDLDLFIQSMSKCIGTEEFGLSFEFSNLTFQPKKALKPIMSEVTGKIDRGSLWGVMGASGAGKSTFVNVLMGKQAHTGGITKINGVPGDLNKYKKIIGYVPQDDILLPELTVRENILHSARIRLPSNLGEVQIQKHVDNLISCLQLAHVKDSLVGNAVKPVISGGQRKRVSIGIELAAAPMALFLDEPTSGLDATSASSIMMALKELSRLNITIITIIHQPRAEIFESLDSLLLFGKGRVIYQGPERDVQAYFEHLGFRFPGSSNPADTIMDIIAGQGHLYKPSGDSGIWHLIHNWKHVQDSKTPRPDSSLSPLTSTMQTPQLGTNSRTQQAISLGRSIRSRGAPIHKQIYHCFLRSLLQQYRLRSSFFFEIGVSTLGGFLIGLARFKSEGINFRGFYLEPYALLSSSIDYSSVPQMSLLVGIAIGLIASSPGVKIFGEEKLVYWREASSGHNRFAYYLGKVLSTFPRMFVACLHFTATFMLLATPRIDWGAAFLAHLLYFYTIYGLASILSMCTRREDGPLLAVMASLIVGVLNGMSPNLTVVADWRMTWLWRALPGTWLAEAYFDKNVGGLAYLYAVGDASQATGYRLGNFGWDCAVLGVIGTVYRGVAFGLMRVVDQRGHG
ncbi:MAG: hypothetical protein L6R35_005823 [Caloplaca aegaea]|nr:MAG: hypothetical protein L6R35_005823 [Caloplaca aegaea]